MTWGLGLVLLGATATIGVILAHIQARFSFVEIALANGFAPQIRPSTTPHNQHDHEAQQVQPQFDPAAVAALAPANAIVLFASSTCATCVRLVDDLSDPSVPDEIDFHLYFEQDPPIVARRGRIYERQSALINTLGVPALPYAVVLADGEAAAHGPVPHTGRLDALMATAGHRHRLPSELVSAP